MEPKFNYDDFLKRDKILAEMGSMVENLEMNPGTVVKFRRINYIRQG